MLNQHVLIIGTVWVEPNSSAAGGRMLQLIKLFLAQHWQVTFACASQKSTKETSLTELGVKEVSIQLNSSSFDDFLNELQPTIVMFDRFMIEEQFGWRVAEHCPNALRILDTEDLHFLRKVRHQQYKKGEDFSNEALLKAEDTKREIAAILRCDLSLIISSYEMELLKNLFKIDESLLYYLPFLFNKIDASKTQKWQSFEDRKGFVFIGNFYHKPNIDAVVTLKKQIWSTIKKQLPNAEMHIYGAYVNQQIKELDNAKEGFLIKGFAKNSKSVISKARVVLAPLNFGAGIKGKLTEAMICGTPSITSKIGAEGMHENLSWNGFIENDYKQFAKKAIELYTNKNSWEQSQKNGIEIINQIYDKDKLELPFINRIKQLQVTIEQHRTKNFLGRLLQHQTLQATKYMNKWIEEKNKPNM
uniref:glycosyltransferase n=1 Tax=uncultured Polaribacter sp. TaxID=174711 RepID=UPI0026184A76|nr:glycosyltransferase [uncultured Polaribacter sp.]